MMNEDTVIYYVGPDANVGWVTGWSRDEHCGKIVSVTLTLNYHDAHKFDPLGRDYDDVCNKLLNGAGSFHCFNGEEVCRENIQVLRYSRSSELQGEHRALHRMQSQGCDGVRKAYVRKMREGNLYTEVHVVRKELAPWTTVKKWSK